MEVPTLEELPTFPSPERQRCTEMEMDTGSLTNFTAMRQQMDGPTGNRKSKYGFLPKGTNYGQPLWKKKETLTGSQHAQYQG